MKPRTKKILIITAAVVVIAVVIYLIVNRKAEKGTAEGYIDRLNTTRSIKSSIKGYLTKAQTEQDIAAYAASAGINYEQALALTAAYYLVNDGTVDDATWQDWKAQIKAM